MKKLLLAAGLIMTCSFAANAQEYIDWIDAHNPVCNLTDKDKGMRETAERLKKIEEMLPFNNVNGMKLDIKALYVVDVNAFACANGSICVFAGLMDIMTDEEILAVMGHEIGHVVNADSKNAFKTALLTSALKDAVASAGGTAAKLSDSQLGSLGEALTNAQFSQKQESSADNYGYELLKKCNVDTKHMAESLSVLHKMEVEVGADKTNKATQLFSSHPGLGKRIENLNKKK